MKLYEGTFKFFRKIIREIKREIAYYHKIKRREKEGEEKRLEYMAQLGEKITYWEDLRGRPPYEVDFKGRFENFTINLRHDKRETYALAEYSGVTIYYVGNPKNKKLLEFYNNTRKKVEDERKRVEEAERLKRKELKKEGEQKLEELLF